MYHSIIKNYIFKRTTQKTKAGRVEIYSLFFLVDLKDISFLHRNMEVERGCGNMEFDSKQKVLVAIYTEYQKDIPNMKDNIRANKLGLEANVFNIALEKLENEGLITDVHFSRGGGRLILSFTDDVKMTREGIEYVENKLEIPKTLTGMQKVQKLAKDGASWGWDQFKDIAARTMAEMFK